MSRSYSRFAVLLALGAASWAPTALAQDCSVRSGGQIVPLVELYTSEGCSSCPPADRWLSRQIASGRAPVNWLAFHVDYWDELGWPDRFGSPRHSERQRGRVNAAGESTVYTPQVMIGPQVRAVWRAEPAVERALTAARGPAKAALALNLQRTPQGGAVGLGASALPSSTGARVWLARTLDSQTTTVRAGENDGATLRHDRVVVELWGPWAVGPSPLSKRIAFEAPVTGDFTAFIEDGKGRMLQSLRLAGGDCR
jgi:hypothetical protein